MCAQLGALAKLKNSEGSAAEAIGAALKDLGDAARVDAELQGVVEQLRCASEINIGPRARVAVATRIDCRCTIGWFRPSLP